MSFCWSDGEICAQRRERAGTNLMIRRDLLQNLRASISSWNLKLIISCAESYCYDHTQHFTLRWPDAHTNSNTVATELNANVMQIIHLIAHFFFTCSRHASNHFFFKCNYSPSPYFSLSVSSHEAVRAHTAQSPQSHWSPVLALTCPHFPQPVSVLPTYL